MRRRLLHAIAVPLAFLAVPATVAQARGTDANHNRIPDRWERRHDLPVDRDVSRRDTDGDGLTNRAEYRMRTDPRRRDTDRDGILDGRDRRPRIRDRRPSPPDLTSSIASGDGALLTDAQAAAAVARSPFDVRPANAWATLVVPSAVQLDRFYRQSNGWGRCEPLKRRVTGAFTGTTDEIIQWGARKWGIDPDVVRAVAVRESSWQASAVGDAGQSYGLMQVKRTASPGTYPLSRDSAAFNADYYGASLRYYLDGCASWLRASDYRRGDLWGSIGAWFSGDWLDEGSRGYAASVRATLTERTWERPGF